MTWRVALPTGTSLVAGTYYTGSNRHRGREKIVSNIRWLLELDA